MVSGFYQSLPKGVTWGGSLAEISPSLLPPELREPALIGSNHSAVKVHPILIYKLSHPESRKAYIGATSKTFLRRWHQHKTASRTGGSTILQRAIRKYGEEGWIMETLFRGEGPLEYRARLEQFFIREHGTLAPDGMNIVKGGQGTPGLVHTPETIARRVLRMNGKQRSGEARRRMSLANRSSKAVVINGTRYPSRSIAAQELGLSTTTVTNRIRNPRWVHWAYESEGTVLLIPADKRCRGVRVDGRYFPSISSAAKALDIPLTSANRRLHSSEFPSWVYDDQPGEQDEPMKDRKGMAVMAEGVLYFSMTQAAETHGISLSAATNRVCSANFPGWRYATARELGGTPEEISQRNRTGLTEDTRWMPMMVDGAYFASGALAARAHGISNATAHNRAKSPHHPKWQYAHQKKK